MGQKITENDVESAIDKVEYHRPEGSTVTICLITLKNGFVCEGFSACADPAEYNQELGEAIAYRNAFSKAWGFLGFGLVDRLHREKMELELRGKGDWKERVSAEKRDLDMKTHALQAFLQLDTPVRVISGAQLRLMKAQASLMHEYSLILGQRLAAD